MILLPYTCNLILLPFYSQHDTYENSCCLILDLLYLLYDTGCFIIIDKKYEFIAEARKIPV